MAEVAQVTGLRPSIGPSTGGTLVTIRGSDLGDSEEDILDVTIGGVSVRSSLRYFSSSKLQCFTAPCSQPSGPVVVTTTAGRGVSHVTFVFEQVESDDDEDPPTIGMLTESRVWKEEVLDDTFGLRLAPASSIDRDPLNLQLEDTRKPLRGEIKSRVQALEEQEGGSHVLSDQHFSPALCLVKLYRDCTRNELERGLRHLERMEEEHDRNLKQLINVSSSTFVSAFDAVLNANRRIKFHKRTLNSASITSKLAESISKLEETTHATYDAILERQKEANQHRAMLHVLATHRFLFNLPRSLRDSIAREEWAQVILDLGKARKLFSDPAVSAFHQVKATIEAIAGEVKATLYRRLSAMPLPLTAIEEITAHLLALDPQSEPGWYAIQQLQSFILSEMERLVGQLANATSLVRSSLDAANADESTREHDTRTQLTLLQAKQRIEDADKPPRILFAEHVCAVAMEFCPMLWRLANSSYPPLDEDEASGSQPTTPSRKRRHSTMYQSMFDASDHLQMDMQRLLVRRKQIKDFVETATLRATSLLRQNLLRAQDDESLEHANARILLPRLASRISGCCKVMRAEKLPEECVTGFEGVLSELHLFTIHTVFRLAEKEIRQLCDKEDWQPLEDGTRTTLPEKFLHILTDTLHSLKEFASASTATADALDQVNVEALLSSTFSSFADVLEQLAMAPVPAHTSRSQSMSGLDEDRGSVSSGVDETTRRIHTLQHRLLCIISNTFYTRDVVAGTLTADLDELRVDLSDLFDATLEKYSELQRRLMDKLVDVQAQSFVTILRHNAAAGLKSLPATLSIRPYVMLILFDLVLLHHEITNTAKGFTGRILAAITEQLSTGMLQAVRQVVGAPPRVITQLHAEVVVFQRVLHAFDNETSLWSGVLKVLASKAAKAKRNSSSGGGSSSSRGRQLPTPGRHSPTAAAPPLTISAEIEAAVDAFMRRSRVHLHCLMQQDSDLSDSDVEV
ncbi:hypothetical protein PTSG_12349 [Salpingoeca rosetta]|uniref:Exocyst complex component n=1 Tax=Salpingoeca rosetta (strain ATCC 50818 / BSB-021) TaxID=946362 RepID=F2UAY3_SALR5|nr:uncharacterized protein PTSG_12349 [Salpingoeca rosetta]EGD73996.1 hypothetical protein PTSG_12349 [Salpingoeca rosetta]|eukprot:XP_004993559.1 hypothetical protein PTSG_12349 [Salpingoeca rosetta]